MIAVVVGVAAGYLGGLADDLLSMLANVFLVMPALLLLIGFPIAYGMERAPRALQQILFFAVVLQFWTAFLWSEHWWRRICSVSRGCCGADTTNGAKQYSCAAIRA